MGRDVSGDAALGGAAGAVQTTAPAWRRPWGLGVLTVGRAGEPQRGQPRSGASRGNAQLTQSTVEGTPQKPSRRLRACETAADAERASTEGRGLTQDRDPSVNRGGVPPLHGASGATGQGRTSALMKPTSANVRSRLGLVCLCRVTSDGPQASWAGLSPPLLFFPEGECDAGAQAGHARLYQQTTYRDSQPGRGRRKPPVGGPPGGVGKPPPPDNAFLVWPLEKPRPPSLRHPRPRPCGTPGTSLGPKCPLDQSCCREPPPQSREAQGPTLGPHLHVTPALRPDGSP